MSNASHLLTSPPLSSPPPPSFSFPSPQVPLLCHSKICNDICCPITVQIIKWTVLYEPDLHSYFVWVFSVLTGKYSPVQRQERINLNSLLAETMVIKCFQQLRMLWMYWYFCKSSKTIFASRKHASATNFRRIYRPSPSLPSWKHLKQYCMRPRCHWHYRQESWVIIPLVT